jgi:hypothetical protein
VYGTGPDVMEELTAWAAYILEESSAEGSETVFVARSQGGSDSQAFQGVCWRGLVSELLSAPTHVTGAWLPGQAGTLSPPSVRFGS